MQNIETHKGIFAYFVSAQEQETDTFTHYRDILYDVGSHGYGPVRKLIIWQKVAGITKQQS
jgi:hypothetical protein